MNIFLILANQNPASLCHSIAKVCQTELTSLGHHVVFHDLYGEKFDPTLTQSELENQANCPPSVQQHVQELADSQGIVIVHPNWWGTPPAILKGWIDRVFRANFAYRFCETGPVPLFGDKMVQVFTTSNTPKEVEIKVYNDPLEHFWKNIVFGLTGCKSFHRQNYESVVFSSPEQRAEWLSQTAVLVRSHFGA